MLNPDLQHCQTKLPWVTSVDAYLLNHPLLGCEDISLVLCVTWKSACPKSWWKPDASKDVSTERWELSFSLVQNMHSFAPPLSWRGLGVQEFGLKRMKVWKWTCGHCTDNPWDACASCRQTLETSVWFLCNRGCKTPFWRAQVCVGMLWDGNPAAVHRHSLLKWCCSFWRQLSVWSRRLDSLPAKSSTSWEDEKDLVPTAVKAACQWYHWKQKCCETNSN